MTKELKLLCLSPIGEPPLREWLFNPRGIQIIFPNSYEQGEVINVVGEADLILGDWHRNLGIFAKEASAAKRCIFIQQPSVGVEVIDLEITNKLGIPVANAAGVNTRAVTEWVLGATIGALRSIPWADNEIRKGNWPFTELVDRGGYELFNKKVGVIGFGPIGSSVARIFSAIGCQVFYWTRTRRPKELEYGASFLELDDLLSSCDIICVTIAKGPETIGLIDKRRISLLRSNAIVTDCSRGGIVDHLALEKRLKNKEILGAALDVFEPEPLDTTSGLRELSNVVLSPHAAFNTVESNLNLRHLVADNITAACQGGHLENIVNGLSPFPRSRA